MLASVFNTKRNRSQKQRKFSATIPSIPGLRRPQSPPSPGSFVSPEIVEINDKGPPGATLRETRKVSRPSIDRAITSPQLQLNFDTGASLSEWLPPSILHPQSRTPPKRNVSLPNGGRSLTDLAAAGPSSTQTQAAEESLKEETEPLQPNRFASEFSVRRGSEDAVEHIAPPSTRKPTPSPIKIPDNAASSKIKAQRSLPDVMQSRSDDVLPPLPTKGSHPPSPSSAFTDEMSSAISGASAFVVNSFIYSNEARASKYKSGGTTRQDSATLPRGEHPLNYSPYLRERRPSAGSLGNGSPRSFSPVPPVPRLPSLGTDTSVLAKRNSVTLVLESGDNNRLVTPPQLKRSKSTGRLQEQTMSMPPISPISEASSPALSVPNTPVLLGQGTSRMSNASSPSLANSVAVQRADMNASSSSLGAGEGSGPARAVNEPSSTDRRPSVSSRSKEHPLKSTLGPSGAMAGTMRSSGALSVANGRFTMTRSISESGSSRGPVQQQARPSVLLPIGERPISVLSPPSPQYSFASNPVSGQLGSVSQAETPVDSPDLLDNFPLQIARERATGPPPPLPLGRRSEENSTISTPMGSSSGESMPPTALTDRQTFPETPNAFSPWSAGFTPQSGNTGRTSSDKGMGSSRVTGPPRALDMMRMTQRGPALRLSSGVYSKPATRSSRVPPTPPLTGEGSIPHPDSPRILQMEPPSPPPVSLKRLTAIEEQVASRSVSQYSTLPEPPTSGTHLSGTFMMQQSVILQPQRERSESVSAYSTYSQPQSQAPDQTSITTSSNTSTAQMKFAEAASNRRMRSVTNPDESLVSPPPSYAPTFEQPPPPMLLSFPPISTAESSEPSRRSSLHAQTQADSVTSIPQKRSLSPFPSPNSSAPSSLGRSRADTYASSISVDQPPPPYMDEHASPAPHVRSVPRALTLAPSTRAITPPLTTPLTPLVSTNASNNTASKRSARIRPPRLPQGPRKPSYSAVDARRRARSASTASNAGPSSSNPRMISMMSHAAPKFQTSRVEFRGLTMEAAQWTLTSQQLQRIVSTAIRQSADASAIRLLPLETLESELPAVIERMEAHSTDLKTRYRLGVRKRNMLLAGVSRVVDGMDASESAVRLLEELSDVTDSLDEVAEELYTTTDHLAQLRHLEELHQRSALAMALRKLNSSFLKQVGDVQRLREQVTMLEAERDEAWCEAQEVAQEFDDFTDRIMPSPSSDRPPSRRSSRVLVARKNSQRASKAGLRSSMYRRSHRSSTSSTQRHSGAVSPGMWNGPGGSEEIPPVPPIPMRRDFFWGGDLPTRSSMDSPSSELRAMVQAQKELCEMLGISLDELKLHNHGPSRRQSMSAVSAPKTPVSPALTRRNSEIIMPNHQRGFKV